MFRMPILPISRPASSPEKTAKAAVHPRSAAPAEATTGRGPVVERRQAMIGVRYRALGSPLREHHDGDALHPLSRS